MCCSSRRRRRWFPFPRTDASCRCPPTFVPSWLLPQARSFQMRVDLRRSRMHDTRPRTACALAAYAVAMTLMAGCASATTGKGAAVTTLSDADVRDQAAMLAMFDTRTRDTVLIDRVLA